MIELKSYQYKLNVGHQCIEDNVENTCGKTFEFNATIPEDYMIKISIYTKQKINRYNLIGSTEVDIENRWYTKHHAKFGIPKNYDNTWRYKYKPSQILANICKDLGFEPPFYFDNKVKIANTIFSNSSLESSKNSKEHIALKALHQSQKIFGFKLVPAHVETRALYRKDKYGIEQGKLELWIELHDINDLPKSMELMLKSIFNFELRIIVWSTADVILNEKNIFGKRMSDIYVKCWLNNSNIPQYTDIHYRSTTGKANFNWRMIFPFKYNVEENMIIKKNNCFYEETKLSPRLIVQIWDSDSFSSDDFLGTLSIPLSDCPIPSRKAANCYLKNKWSRVNLFTVRKLKGWFPVFGLQVDQGKHQAVQTGKIKLELEIVSEFDNVQRVGLGRNPPNSLSFPKREDANFIWYKHPFKSLKSGLAHKIREIFLIFINIVLLTSVACFVTQITLHF
ncbi:fer-1-like protein 6 [Culicoides brevitarsis]|uniref:fer-1-like protein 6 n=1 Tax=Culicoides brevitarsis TaxID=469753 RepID=UPI00307BB8BD